MQKSTHERNTELELQEQITINNDKTVEEVAEICINIIENLGYIGLDKWKQ